jgi:hypothetical protein
VVSRLSGSNAERITEQIRTLKEKDEKNDEEKEKRRSRASFRNVVIF